MKDTQQNLAAKLQMLDDDLDIYDYFIEKAFACECPDIRFPEYKIAGCVSGLWVKADLIDGKVMVFADSDSLLIRGVATAICEIYNGMTPEEAKITEITFLDGYDLAGELDETRRNGLSHITKIIKNL